MIIAGYNWILFTKKSIKLDIDMNRIICYYSDRNREESGETKCRMVQQGMSSILSEDSGPSYRQSSNKDGNIEVKVDSEHMEENSICLRSEMSLHNQRTDQQCHEPDTSAIDSAMSEKCVRFKMYDAHHIDIKRSRKLFFDLSAIDDRFEPRLQQLKLIIDEMKTKNISMDTFSANNCTNEHEILR